MLRRELRRELRRVKSLWGVLASEELAALTAFGTSPALVNFIADSTLCSSDFEGWKLFFASVRKKHWRVKVDQSLFSKKRVLLLTLSFLPLVDVEDTGLE